MARKWSRFVVVALVGVPSCLASLLVLGCFILGIAWLVLGPGYKWQLAHFLSKMKEEVSAAELRDWAAMQIENAQGQRLELTMPDQDSPETVEILSRTSYGPPVYLTIEPAGDQELPRVVATWGSGFGHWGLIIGSSDLDEKSNDWSYCVKWDEGVFGWAEIQR